MFSVPSVCLSEGGTVRYVSSRVTITGALEKNKGMSTEGVATVLTRMTFIFFLCITKADAYHAMKQ